MRICADSASWCKSSGRSLATAKTSIVAATMIRWTTSLFIRSCLKSWMAMPQKLKKKNHSLLLKMTSSLKKTEEEQGKLSDCPFDPNVLFAPTDHEYRIYGNDNASIWAVVDEIDYHWLLHWLWSPKVSRGGRKIYLRRSLHEGSGALYLCPETGRIRRNRTQRTLFLHTAVMLRTGIEPPSKEHRFVDHRDGDSMNCRRSNLRWATPSMNARNIRGSHRHELGE